MGRLMRICLQSLLKLVNSIIGFVGMGMILYALWMIRVWYKHMDSFWDDSIPPWFMYTFLGLGVFLCFITCSGHIAAETANGHCLSCYTVLLFMLVLMEAAITADVFLNKNWEEDFPEDKTGKFDALKKFVESNFDMCKWTGLGIVGAQALSIVLAMVLRALGSDNGSYYDSDLAMVLRALGSDNGSYYDSDEDYIPARLPLLRNQVQHAPPYPPAPHLTSINDSWKQER